MKKKRYRSKHLGIQIGLVFCVLLLASCDFSFDDDSDDLTLAIPDPERKLYGFIDESGSNVLPFQYTYAFDFAEGLAAVNVGGTYRYGRIPTDGKWGFIDSTGKFVINPTFESPPFSSSWVYSPSDVGLVMHEGYIFSESLAAVWKTDRWIYIDKKGKVVIAEVDGNPILSARKFSGGLAAVQINQLWGFIDISGELVISPSYLFPSEFRNGYAFVIDENLKRYCIDPSGQPRFLAFRLGGNFSDGIASFKEPLLGTTGKVFLEEELKSGLMDTLGRPLIEPKYEKIGKFKAGLVPVLFGSQPDELLGYPDERIEATSFIGGKWGFINLKDEIVIKPVYDDARAFYRDRAAVKKDGKWGFINRQNELVINYQFHWVEDFYKSIARVKISSPQSNFNNRFAYINRDGDIIHIFPK